MAAKSSEDLFREFIKAVDLAAVMSNFEALCASVRLPKSRNWTDVYPALRGALQTQEANGLWQLLDARDALVEYKHRNEKACRNMKVLIVGAGPCGLRMAIECAFLGAHAIVVEKRDYFTRNNILHLWPFAMHDLRALGARILIPRFGSGSLDNIGTRKLQLFLLKIALLLGVEFHVPVEFKDIDEIDAENGEARWRGVFGEGASTDLLKHCFDVVVGADGTHPSLKGFKQTFTRNRLAIAILANFENKRTPEEKKLQEVAGLAYYCNQDFFNDKERETGIALENYVYFKDDTHYFVMCAKKQSLLDKGVFIKDQSDAKQLLAPSNIDRMALHAFARQATHSTIGHVPDLQFSRTHRGEEDVAVFDFTNIYVSENSCYALERGNRNLLVCCVGDALCQPFWPTGTGIARGFLGVYDAAWLIRNWAIKDRSFLDLIAERETLFQLLKHIHPNNLKPTVGKFTINPQTRYDSKIQLRTVTAAQVKKWYKVAGESGVLKRKINYEEENLPKKSNMDRSFLLRWYQKKLESFQDRAPVTDLSSSWRNGMAFCALIQLYRPELINIISLDPRDIVENTSWAFEVIEREFDVAPKLSPAELAKSDIPDRFSMLSYLVQLQLALKDEPLPQGATDALPACNVDVKTKPNPVSVRRKLKTVRRKENGMRQMNDPQSLAMSLSVMASLALLPGKRRRAMQRTQNMNAQFASLINPRMNKFMSLAPQWSAARDLSSFVPQRKMAIRRHSPSDPLGTPGAPDPLVQDSRPPSQKLENLVQDIKPVVGDLDVRVVAASAAAMKPDENPAQAPDKEECKPVKPTVPKKPVVAKKPVVQTTPEPVAEASHTHQLAFVETQLDDTHLDETPEGVEDVYSESGHPSLMACSNIVKNRLKNFIQFQNNATESPKKGPPSVAPRFLADLRGSIVEEEDDLDNTLTEQGVRGEVRPGGGEVRPVGGEVRPGGGEVRPDVLDVRPGARPVLPGAVEKDGDTSNDHAAGAAPYEPEDMGALLPPSHECAVCSEEILVFDWRTAHGYYLHEGCYACRVCATPLDVDNSHLELDIDGRVTFYCEIHSQENEGGAGDWNGYAADHAPSMGWNQPLDADTLTAFDFTLINKEDVMDDVTDEDDPDESHDYENNEDLFEQRTNVCMSLMIQQELCELRDDEQHWEQRGRSIEQSLRSSRAARLSAVEESEELINEWLEAIQKKIDLSNRHSRLELLTRLMELQSRRSDLKNRLQAIRESDAEMGLPDELDACRYEEEISKLTTDIADLQDFLDIYQHLPD